MRLQGRLHVGTLLRHFRWQIALTWLLVLLENTLLALIPLFVGRAIDALLGQDPKALWEVGFVMAALVILATARRIYDTRCYGTMRVLFGTELVRRMRDRPVSEVNARLDMGREVVDFLESHAPELLTSAIQVVVGIAVLWTFDSRLGASGLAIMAGLAAIYALFHQAFHSLNGDLNTQAEQQVSVLERKHPASLSEHLNHLRRHEVRLSDTEALLYAALFIGIFAFVLTNMWIASTMATVTAGTIFTILSYSWELAEAGMTMPKSLQQWSRLNEIRDRLNGEPAGLRLPQAG